MPELKALIFDVDGTLADTEELHRRAFNQAFAGFGLDWHWSPLLYSELLLVSGGQERIHHYAKRLGAAFDRPANLSEYLREIHLAKTLHYTRMLSKTTVPLRPGVHRLLLEARSQGVKLAIATSTSLSNVISLLDKNLPTGWASWFDCIATSDTVVEKKPSPAVYNHVLAQMHLSATECVTIEDTENGNRAALAAGLKTIITPHAFTRNHDFTDASLVLDHLGEPNQPFKVIAGNVNSARYVDLALVGRLLGEQTDPNASPESWKPMPVSAKRRAGS